MQEKATRKPGPSTYIKRFASWLTFSLALTSTLVIAQSLAKVPERLSASKHSAGEIHWLTGQEPATSYVGNRLLFILGVSLPTSVLAAIAHDKPEST